MLSINKSDVKKREKVKNNAISIEKKIVFFEREINLTLSVLNNFDRKGFYFQ